MTKQLPLISGVIFALCAAALPTVARAGAPYYGVQVNGACDVGSCNFTNPVPYNTSTPQTISINTTLLDGDQFTISGNGTAYDNSNGGYLPEGMVYSVTYDGDGHGGASLNDTINVNMFLGVSTSYGYGNFDAGAVGYLSSGLGSGSSASYSGYGNGTGNSPYLAGPYTSQGSFNGDYTNTMSSVNGEFEFELSSASKFAAGSAAGSYILYGQTTPLTSVPEPASIALLGTGLLGLAGLLRFRRSEI